MSVNVKIRLFEDKDHIIVPVVMLTEGVHHGSQGPIYYPKEELRSSAHLWNARPIVVYHPDLYGGGSAGSPKVFERQRVGVVFHTTFVDNKLKAEAWLDIERLKKVNHRVLDAIRANEMVEVSTGLYFDVDERAGVFNSETYHGIVKNIRPDHLAILPDMIGACSIADGCGLLRNADEVEEPLYVSAL